MEHRDPKFTYQGKKYPHDLSHEILFTSSVGQLLPVLSDFLYPDDHIKISCNLFTRMAELNTAAFTRMREHIEFFFVPFQQMYTPFASFIYGVGRPHSSLLQPPLNNYNLPYFSGEYPDLTGTDLMGQSVEGDFNKLMDLLGYSMYPHYLFNQDTPVGVNFWSICAYHKVFYDYYCMEDRTTIQPYLYNLDDLANGQYWFNANTRSSKDFFSLHYRPFMHDYYTDTKVSPLQSPNSVNSWGNLSGKVKNWLSNKSNPAIVDPTGSAGTDNSTTIAYATANNLAQSSLTTANIRVLFAVDKLLEITRRNKKDYAHQTMAHFGASVPEGISNRAYKLGSITQDLTIQDVDATASSSVGDAMSILGQQGGKGVTTQQNNRYIEFTAPCHGVLLAIYSCEPQTMYPSSMLNRLNTYYQREDFFTPEYDSLGMQPLFGYELNIQNVAARSNVYGWQYRYQESKQKFNRVTTGFNTQGLSSWRTVRSIYDVSDFEKGYYISPEYLNSIMLVDYDNDDMGTDPLRHSLFFAYFKSSVMSNFSLPNLSGNK